MQNRCLKMKKMLFASQSSLPRLPVPSLDETLSLFITSARALSGSESQLLSTMSAVDQFRRTQGPELQSRLLSRAAACSSSSWLIQWWNDYAYLAYRDPLPVYVNYFYVFKDDKLRMNPAIRAASLVKGALEMSHMISDETLEPDTAKGSPLCSQQYKYMFNSTRIPAFPADQTRTSSPSNSHIIVIRKNKFYEMETKQKQGDDLSMADLVNQFKAIYEMAGSDKGPPLGILTSENRDIWAKCRETLILDPVNKSSLDRIETALFVVCLDDSKPVTREDASIACWHGDGQNRFFDKSLQLIVFDNGKAGFNGEHSMMDATPTFRMCDFILSSIASEKLDLKGLPSSSPLPLPTLLPFNTLQVTSTITSALAHFKELTEKEDLKVCVFDGYGKKNIKKMGLSPDAYAQMAIQLAYFKVYGECVATYESAQTKKYEYGRTETCRSVSVESVEWVKAMHDSSKTAQFKGDLGRRAISAQTAYMAKAVEGKGVDRHFLGLKKCLKENEPLPPLYSDPLFVKSSYWKLSTSQITSEYFDGYGWGQVVDDGYGIAYMVKDDSLHFNLVSKHLRNNEMRTALLESLTEMKSVFESPRIAGGGFPSPKL